MRPGQNKRLRGRNNNRKGPNPLTRSFESNGPDVKIRGTAQHVAEKYLQLARDAQSSGDIIAAENLLQHAEHYFRLIAAAQNAQQQTSGGYGRQSFEAEAEVDEDDDFVALPDRFAPLSERLPQQPALAPPPFQAQPQPPVQQPHFQPPQQQPFDERLPFEPRHERPARPERPFGDRNRDRGRDRSSEAGGERQTSSGLRPQSRQPPISSTPRAAGARRARSQSAFLHHGSRARIKRRYRSVGRFIACGARSGTRARRRKFSSEFASTSSSADGDRGRSPGS